MGESSKEEHWSASVSPTRRKSIRIQAKAMVTPRWAWAFVSSGLPVSDTGMGSRLAVENKTDEALPLRAETLGAGEERQ